MSDLMETTGTRREQEVLRVAQELFRQKPTWLAFFREVFGLEGVAKRLFPTAQEMTAFEQTAEYAEIQAMIDQLRQERPGTEDDAEDTTRVITVRLPKSLHESLKDEAKQRNTSMNKLCIAKLLKVIAEAELGTAAIRALGTPDKD